MTSDPLPQVLVTDAVWMAPGSRLMNPSVAPTTHRRLMLQAELNPGGVAVEALFDASKEGIEVRRKGILCEGWSFRILVFIMFFMMVYAEIF